MNAPLMPWPLPEYDAVRRVTVYRARTGRKVEFSAMADAIDYERGVAAFQRRQLCGLSFTEAECFGWLDASRALRATK